MTDHTIDGMKTRRAGLGDAHVDHAEGIAKLLMVDGEQRGTDGVTFGVAL